MTSPHGGRHYSERHHFQPSLTIELIINRAFEVWKTIQMQNNRKADCARTIMLRCTSEGETKQKQSRVDACDLSLPFVTSCSSAVTRLGRARLGRDDYNANFQKGWSCMMQILCFTYILHQRLPSCLITRKSGHRKADSFTPEFP